MHEMSLVDGLTPVDHPYLQVRIDDLVGEEFRNIAEAAHRAELLGSMSKRFHVHEVFLHEISGETWEKILVLRSRASGHRFALASNEDMSRVVGYHDSMLPVVMCITLLSEIFAELAR